MGGYIILGVVILLIIILIGFIISIYNNLVKFKVRVDNAWSQIDVMLKKRFDLVPNLVNTVKGYAAHEKGTLEAVVQARNQAVGAQTQQEAIDANNTFAQALSRLLMLVENYPDLKADKSFIDLQNQLSQLEHQIAISRQFYNDTVMKYNQYIASFPSNLFANAFHFTERPYFQLDNAQEKQAPTVSF
jgi:LemA protein